MDYKKAPISRTTQTRDLRVIEEKTGNIYESIVAVAKRSNVISEEMKNEILRKIDEFKTNNDNLDEVFENNEQIEVSKYFENLPKPYLVALEEMIHGELAISNSTERLAREYREGEEEVISEARATQVVK